MAVSPYLGHVYDDGELGEEAVSPYLGHVYDDGELGEEAVDLGVKHGNLAEGEGEASVGIWGLMRPPLPTPNIPFAATSM